MPKPENKDAVLTNLELIKDEIAAVHGHANAVEALDSAADKRRFPQGLGGDKKPIGKAIRSWRIVPADVSDDAG